MHYTYKTYKLGQRWIAYTLLLGFFSQSCNNTIIPTSPGEDNPTHSISLRETEQEQKTTNELAPDSSANNLLTLQAQEDGEGIIGNRGLQRGMKRRNNQQLLQESTKIEKNDQNAEVHTSNILPKEIWQYIFSCISVKQIEKVRQVNRAFYSLTTGYQRPGQVGVSNKPAYNINVDGWMINEWIDFSVGKYNELTPLTISSQFFYQFLEKVKNLSQAFWPHLKGTHIKEIDLNSNRIGASKAAAFAKNLQGTSVHTLDLSGNQIGNKGVIELAKYLQGTSVHTVVLSYNQIGDKGITEFAKNLKGTSIHTLNLSGNQIGGKGAIELAKNLKDTSVRQVVLAANKISDSGAIGFAKNLQGVSIEKVVLVGNKIGDSGAIELAKNLQGTSVKEVALWSNQIGYETQKLLRKQYPYITWEF